MRLHSDLVTLADIYRAADNVPDVTIGTATPHGSRKRKRGFEIVLAGTGIYGGAYGQFNGNVATWDEWGMFLAALYAIDPDMVAGPYPHDHPDEYESFHWATDGRYRHLLPQDKHARHRWNFVGLFDTYSFVPGTVARYSEQECKCGAVRRYAMSRVKGEVIA